VAQLEGLALKLPARIEALKGRFIERIDQNEDITAKLMNEERFREIVSQHLLKEVYEQIRAEEASSASSAT